MKRILVVLCLMAVSGLGAEEKVPEESTTNALPRLVDLGAHKCIACKKMAPILEELTKEYSELFTVEFIDVWQKENVKKAKTYGIKAIPTQIFFDAKGKELWRHEGFLSKKAILKKWKEHGVKVKKQTAKNK